MFGPLTVVYNSSSSNTGKALVAIDWQPTSEQPGGHPVDAPPTEDCLNIPGLVDCGVIVPEFMGYTQRYVVFKNLFEPMYRVVDKINRWRAIVCKATKAEPSAHLNSPLPSTGTPHTKRRSESSEPAEPGNSLKRH
ncbi:hypothetical protein EC988_001478 [Linderina pennispora]|nr:hypothetical protein EC988_001478 [Linderina pennispora]